VKGKLERVASMGGPRNFRMCAIRGGYLAAFALSNVEIGSTREHSKASLWRVRIHKVVLVTD
jgi:hypothetical protein